MQPRESAGEIERPRPGRLNPDPGPALWLFTQLRRIALDAYNRIVGLLLEDVAVDGRITTGPGGGEVGGPSPVDRRNKA
ncbi:hypothetical protein GCM10023320_40210 [Pseudonocardia adelaidensis]|uniref:Uncharacterized protein n=1 Tax=Pseudonocardia adelaidensis TaxID=648754 RepID=A0ABP9NRS2_9PSEU